MGKLSFEKIRKNVEKNEDALHKERLERCIPVARLLLKHILAKVDEIPFGDDVQNSDEYDKLSSELLLILLENNIRWSDRQFVFQLALQPLAFPKDIVDNALTQHWNVALTGLFGKRISELTMLDLDERLKRGDKIEEPLDETKE